MQQGWNELIHTGFQDRKTDFTLLVPFILSSHLTSAWWLHTAPSIAPHWSMWKDDLLWSGMVDFGFGVPPHSDTHNQGQI